MHNTQRVHNIIINTRTLFTPTKINYVLYYTRTVSSVTGIEKLFKRIENTFITYTNIIHIMISILGRQTDNVVYMQCGFT
jgi:hypothetical protein